MRVSCISLQTPAIVDHHVFIPDSLLSLFDVLDILMESFALLLTQVTKIFRKAIYMRMQEVYFKNHQAVRSGKICYNPLHYVFLIRILFFPRNFETTSLKLCQAASSILVIFFNSVSISRAHMWSLSSTPSFILASDSLGNFKKR